MCHLRLLKTSIQRGQVVAMVSQLRTKRAFCNDGNVLDILALSNMVTTENLKQGWCDLGTNISSVFK